MQISVEISMRKSKSLEKQLIWMIWIHRQISGKSFIKVRDLRTRDSLWETIDQIRPDWSDQWRLDPGIKTSETTEHWKKDANQALDSLVNIEFKKNISTSNASIIARPRSVDKPSLRIYCISLIWSRCGLYVLECYYFRELLPKTIRMFKSVNMIFITMVLDFSETALLCLFLYLQKPNK